MTIQTPDKITLTDLDLERCAGPSGFFCGEVVRLLGEDMRVKGWHRRLRGKVVLRSVYEQARGYARLPRLKGVERGEARGQMPLL